jgi:hypothetical protein
LLLAEEAAAARDRKRHDDAVAHLQLRVLVADLDDLAHEFVSENIASLHRRNVAVEQMEIRSADGGRCDPHDRVAWIENLRIGNPLDADVVGGVPDQCFHECLAPERWNPLSRN